MNNKLTQEQVLCTLFHVEGVTLLVNLYITFMLKCHSISMSEFLLNYTLGSVFGSLKSTSGKHSGEVSVLKCKSDVYFRNKTSTNLVYLLSLYK